MMLGQFIRSIARKIEAISATAETCCIFDDKAACHAVYNVLELWSLTDKPKRVAQIRRAFEKHDSRSHCWRLDLDWAIDF